MRIFLCCFLFVFIMPSVAHADCDLVPNGTTILSPETRPAGTILYNSDHRVFQGCVEDHWVSLNVSGAAGALTGYFVLSKTTHNGNFSGDRANADNWCLSQLTANTGWQGYSAANDRGQLVSGKVHAYICSCDACNRLQQNTTYYFANANDAGAGGASFTTDSMGYGPHDSNNWSGAPYFNESVNWWSMAGNADDNTVDPRVVEPSGNTAGCLTASGNGQYGTTNATNYRRWNRQLQASSTAYRVICYVDP